MSAAPRLKPRPSASESHASHASKDELAAVPEEEANPGRKA